MPTILYSAQHPDGRLFDPTPKNSELEALTKAGFVDHPDKIGRKAKAIPPAGSAKSAPAPAAKRRRPAAEPLEVEQLEVDTEHFSPEPLKGETRNRAAIDQMLDSLGEPDGVEEQEEVRVPVRPARKFVKPAPKPAAKTAAKKKR